MTRLFRAEICGKIFKDRSYARSVYDDPVDGVVERHHVEDVLPRDVARFDVGPKVKGMLCISTSFQVVVNK